MVKQVTDLTIIGNLDEQDQLQLKHKLFRRGAPMLSLLQLYPLIVLHYNRQTSVRLASVASPSWSTRSRHQIWGTAPWSLVSSRLFLAQTREHYWREIWNSFNLEFRPALPSESFDGIPNKSKYWATIKSLLVPTKETLVSDALKRIKLQPSKTVYTLPEWDILIIFRDLLRIQSGKRIRGSPSGPKGIDQCCPFDEEGFARIFSREELVEFKEWFRERERRPLPLRTSPLYRWESYCRKTLRFWSRTIFEVSLIPRLRNFVYHWRALTSDSVHTSRLHLRSRSVNRQRRRKRGPTLSNLRFVTGMKFMPTTLSSRLHLKLIYLLLFISVSVFALECTATFVFRSCEKLAARNFDSQHRLLHLIQIRVISSTISSQIYSKWTTRSGTFRWRTGQAKTFCSLTLSSFPHHLSVRYHLRCRRRFVSIQSMLSLSFLSQVKLVTTSEFPTIWLLIDPASFQAIKRPS